MNTMSRKCATALVFGLAALATAFGFDQGSAQPARPAPPATDTSRLIGIPVYICKPVSPCCPMSPSCPLSMPPVSERSTSPAPIGLVIPGWHWEAPNTAAPSGR